MPNKFYIKLYLEILDDPKMGMMTDKDFRSTINMFLLAGTIDDEGKLPSVETMAWRLRKSSEDVLLTLEALSELGIVELREDGWFVSKYSTRQAPLSDKQRMRNWRDRKQKSLYYDDEPVTAGVTPPLRQRNIELKLESELNKELNRSEKPDPEPDPEPKSNPKEQLLIDKTKGGLIVKNEMDKARDSKGRGAILYYANAQQRDEFLKVFDILGSELAGLVRKGIIKERESRSSLLAFLQACARNKNTETKKRAVTRTSAQQTLTQLEKTE